VVSTRVSACYIRGGALPIEVDGDVRNERLPRGSGEHRGRRKPALYVHDMAADAAGFTCNDGSYPSRAYELADSALPTFYDNVAWINSSGRAACSAGGRCRSDVTAISPALQ